MTPPPTSTSSGRGASSSDSRVSPRSTTGSRSRSPPRSTWTSSASIARRPSRPPASSSCARAARCARSSSSSTRGSTSPRRSSSAASSSATTTRRPTSPPRSTSRSTCPTPRWWGSGSPRSEGAPVTSTVPSEARRGICSTWPATTRTTRSRATWCGRAMPTTAPTRRCSSLRARSRLTPRPCASSASTSRRFTASSRSRAWWSSRTGGRTSRSTVASRFMPTSTRPMTSSPWRRCSAGATPRSAWPTSALAQGRTSSSSTAASRSSRRP